MMGMMRRQVVLLAVALVAAVSCFDWNWNAQLLPAPVSVPSHSPSRPSGLRAGFGRADITPPPGVGLSGNGPEGRRAVGYRMRLYARALVLEDEAGEQVAILVADLPHLSPNLHRLTAQRICRTTGIGADRLILSATHTHAGPSHHYAEREYNQHISQVPGYDPAMVEFLVSRFTQAILEAHARLRRARVAWHMTPVWGHTRNRSYDAFLRNKPEWTRPFPPPLGLDPARVAVDPVWTMLRVDTLGSGRDGYYPAGGLSIFAIHGTGNPADNDLLDPDIQGVVDRRVERHIDTLTARMTRRSDMVGDSATMAIHLLANGTEGDVSPDWPSNARCGVASLQPVLHPGGPRSPPAPWDWHDPPSRHEAYCLAAARAYVRAVGDTLGRRAAELYDSLGTHLADTFRIAVAFSTLRLRGYDGLCPDPEAGTSTAAGAEDGPTRVGGWKLFGIFPLGLEQGGSAIRKNPEGCQREKQVLAGSFQKHWPFVGRHGLPEVAQLSVVRIGDLLIAAVPAEVTTMAGAAMKRAILDSAHANRLPATGVAVIGLANGYLQYVTTDQEYGAQDYEGGSTLYGPRSAAVLTTRLAEMAGQLGRQTDGSPVNPVDSLWAYPGKSSVVLARGDAGPPLEQIRRRFFGPPSCAGDTVVVRWLDAYPGRLMPADGLILRIERRVGQSENSIIWDDDPYVEVRAVKPERDGYVWEVRWDRHGESGPVRVMLLPRSGLNAVTGEWCPWPGAGPKLLAP